jgi:hypothetical protein
MLITIANFPYPIDANLAKSRLEAEGIDCVLTNEHIAGMNWYWPLAIGGVGLQVAESDAERAVEILESVASGEDEIGGD